MSQKLKKWGKTQDDKLTRIFKIRPACGGADPTDLNQKSIEAVDRLISLTATTKDLCPCIVGRRDSGS
eukprot:9754139-Ditylum_brightwellii.AAC.1